MNQPMTHHHTEQNVFSYGFKIDTVNTCSLIHATGLTMTTPFLVQYRWTCWWLTFIQGKPIPWPHGCYVQHWNRYLYQVWQGRLRCLCCSIAVLIIAKLVFYKRFYRQLCYICYTIHKCISYCSLVMCVTALHFLMQSCNVCYCIEFLNAAL